MNINTQAMHTVTMNIANVWDIIHKSHAHIDNKIASIICLSLLQLAILSNVALVADKPHILFLMVDDWGWANVGYHRQEPTREVQTPNFDGLVKDGLELDQHYAYSVCSPSRSSFMSGRLPIHVNDVNAHGIYNPNDPMSGFAGIPRNMTGIAEKLNQAGYVSHMVGKWHAGDATFDHIPTGRGFNSSFGYLRAANDYYNETTGFCNGTGIVDLWDTMQPAYGVNGTGTDNYEEALFHDRALEIISKHDQSKPLFLYYGAHLIHKPYQVPDQYLNMYKYINNSDRQYYHAMTKYMDDTVGDIVNSLKEHNLWDNLLFVVSSDNGGPVHSDSGGNNFPLKGGKTSDWQGGVRVNAFVSGGFLPGKMRGQKTEGYVHMADWYATFCALAGVDPTDGKAAKAKLPPIDSLNMWPLISGQNSTSPRVDVPISYATLISGDYKILQGNIGEAGWTGPQYPNTTSTAGLKTVEHCGQSGCLYNIKDDPSEYVNLANKLPKVLKDMKNKLASYQSTYFNPNRGKQWPGCCADALGKYKGFWGPFVN